MRCLLQMTNPRNLVRLVDSLPGSTNPFVSICTVDTSAETLPDSVARFIAERIFDELIREDFFSDSDNQ